jgi:hypothetical protein
MWDDDVVSRPRDRRVGRRLRKVALVTLMLFAAVVAPIALPIRILVERVRRDTRKTEQVVRQETRAGLADPVLRGLRQELLVLGAATDTPRSPAAR